MNGELTRVENRVLFAMGNGSLCPVCGGTLMEMERIQEYRFTYILYRCGTSNCRKEYLEKQYATIRD
jgi:hypothetical protein